MKQVISDNHIKALKLIISIFHEHNITYRVTGGLAGNLYGSQWQLQDIDIEVAQRDINKIVELFQEYIVIHLMRLVDDEFDLLMLTLEVHGVDVEINQAEDAFVFSEDATVRLNHDLSNYNTVAFEGLEIRVQPLDQIINYKELLGRENDLYDLRQLL
jgi:hypothetical protein